MPGHLVRSAVESSRRWLLAGLVATIVLTVLLEGVARIVLGGPMKPAALLCQVLGWDADLLWVAEIIHYALGLIAFPIGFVVLHAILGLGSAVMVGAVWGVLLWIGAGAVMAPLAGMPLFFDAGRMMTASLIAHVAYGVVLGGVFARGTAAQP